MEQINKSNHVLKKFKRGDTLYYEYDNEYEPFDDESGTWQKDSEVICKYYDEFSSGNAVIGRHWHESLEIIHMVEGTIEVTTSNGNILVSDGEIIIIGGSYLHGIKSISKQGHHQCLHIRYDFLVKHLDCDDLSLKVFKIGNISKLLFYYESVIQNLKHDSYIGKMKFNANLLLLLTAIIEDSNYNNENLVKNNLNTNINKIIYYINYNYKDNITLNSVAAEFSYTPQNISILFKKSLGKTFHKYLTDIRLENAVHLLLNSNKRGIEIALECGFPNEMSFINKFKIKYKMTPNAYRKQQNR